MRTALFVTCLVDQCWPSAGLAAAKVLNRAGCEVDFDPRQTCCGQPAFNTGYRAEARKVARRNLDLFASADAVVVPSGSCAAMFHHFEALFEGDPPAAERARGLSAKTFELSDFLVNRLGIEDLGARWDGRLAWHDACHGLRELGLKSEPRKLIAKVRGTTLVELAHADACCGFGGTFSVTYPEISVAIADRKIDELAAAGVDAVASSDVSCLMQIGGRLSRRGIAVQTLHLAEVLASDRG